MLFSCLHLCLYVMSIFFVSTFLTDLSWNFLSQTSAPNPISIVLALTFLGPNLCILSKLDPPPQPPKWSRPEPPHLGFVPNSTLLPSTDFLEHFGCGYGLNLRRPSRMIPLGIVLRKTPKQGNQNRKLYLQPFPCVEAFSSAHLTLPLE